MPNMNSTDSSINKLTDLLAEKSVLGSCIIDPDAIVKVAPLLSEQDFFRAAYGDIFAAMCQLADQQRPIDPVTLASALESAGKLDSVGGYAGITDLFCDVPTAMFVEHYAAIVGDKAMKRRLLGAAGTIAEAAYTDNSAETALDLAEQALIKVSQGKQKRAMAHVGDIMRAVIDALSAQESHLAGLSTGFGAVDNMLGGLQKSDLIYVAGRPGMGKSAWALSVAQNVAKSGGSVAIFSLEMSKEQLTQRLLSMTTMIEANRLRTRRLGEQDWALVMEAANDIANLPLYIDDSSGVSIDYVRREARRIYADSGLDLIMVDYMQLMTGTGNNREQEIAYISRNLKAMARELDVPVIALSQLSRKVEERGDKRPMLSDLRESGSQEQDADAVLLIYRDDYYHEESSEQNIAEIILAKHRHGATGSVKLFFRRELTLFRDLEIQREELYAPPPSKKQSTKGAYHNGNGRAYAHDREDR